MTIHVYPFHPFYLWFPPFIPCICGYICGSGGWMQFAPIPNHR